MITDYEIKTKALNLAIEISENGLGVYSILEKAGVLEEYLKG